MATEKDRGPNRPYPVHTLSEVLVVSQKIRDEKAGKPMNRLLLADALAIKPSSSVYRVLLSSSIKYGLTEGSHNVNIVSLTPLGEAATATDAARRHAALRTAAMEPKVFRQFYEAYDGNKLPSETMLPKVLVSEFEVPDVYAEECARILIENGRMVGIIRDISGSPHVMLDDEGLALDEGSSADPVGEEAGDGDDGGITGVGDDGPQGAGRGTTIVEPVVGSSTPVVSARPKAIFLGHGKAKGPLEKLQKQLSTFQIPAKVAVSEPNLGRPIPTKVRDTMQQCGSAILIFTKDEKFFDADGNELWRPSENVVFELGAASYLYEDRVVILKQKGVTFPSNFASIGYIEFDDDAIEARWMEVLQELIGFGLVKLTTG